MPVVDLEYLRLEKLTSSSRQKIRDALPYLGLDIEHESDDSVRVEYSPNRPDYSTEYGIAPGLRGLLGADTGYHDVRISRSQYEITVGPAVSKIRPYVACIAAKGGRLDDHAIRQLVSMQEDLHAGLGRRRRKAAIGLHDMSDVSFPLRYDAIPRSAKFVPLNSDKKMSVSQVLKNTAVGRSYGHLLSGHSLAPAILDDKGSILSVPPIINSAMTTVTPETRDILVDITGLGEEIRDVLAVAAITLQEAGFSLHRIRTAGEYDLQPKSRTMRVEPRLINQTLGLKLSADKIAGALQRCRLGAKAKGSMIHCRIPSYRFDILGPMDMVEEAALGYGIRRLSPRLPPALTIGRKDAGYAAMDAAGRAMIGLGYFEGMSSSLTSSHVLYEIPKRDSSGKISVMESKSAEHTLLRDAILPELLDSLSHNIHEPYPQKIFEIGTVFLPGQDGWPIQEETRFACVNASAAANFSEMKSDLQAALRAIGLECSTISSVQPMFAQGRTADIISGGAKIGGIGEIDSGIISELKIRVPVAAFEVRLCVSHSAGVPPWQSAQGTKEPRPSLG